MGRRSIVRVVDGGRVWCPRVQNDVDVKDCYSCQYLTHLSDDGDTLACRAPASVSRQFGDFGD